MELVGNFVATSAGSIKAALKAWGKKAWKAHEARMQQRADYWILRNMSDYDLKDIGITRGEIQSLVYRK